jgi:hypothetical protein
MRFAKQLSVGGRTLSFELESIRSVRRTNQTPKPKRQWFLGVRIVALLAVLMLAIGIWTGARRDFRPPKIVDTANSPFQFSQRVIAMEFLQTPEQLPVILGREANNSINSQNRLAMRAEMGRDFVFIACYGLLYVAVSLLFARRRSPWAVYLACVAGVCGVGAALFDIRENLAILNVLNALDLNQLVDQQAVNAIHTAAILKWELSFVTAGLLALTFYGLDDWLSLIGYALTLTAVIGFAGLLYLPLLPWAFVPMIIGLILLSILALFRPRKFVKEYC